MAGLFLSYMQTENTLFSGKRILRRIQHALRLVEVDLIQLYADVLKHLVQGLSIMTEGHRTVMRIVLLNEHDQDENFVVIPKNAKIPTKGEQHARTVVDQQSCILVRVTQGEDRDVRYVTEIGSKEIPIPSYPKGAPFTVAYAYDIDQTVYIELYDETAHNIVGKFEIDRIMNMSEEEVQNAMRKISQMDIL